MSIRTIKYTAKYEDLISRIPGLFAYIELDDKGNSVLHKATDSPMGCYGKVIENVKYNGKVYNYKELLNRYYNNDISNDLKDFVEKGIGKENVIFDTLDRKKQDLVPDFVYLALVKPLYGEMLKLRDKVNFYKNHIDNRDKIDNETEESLDCVCKLYERHGGDGYLNFLGGLFSKVEDVSNEYFNYANDAVNDGNRFCLNYAVNLFSTVKDMGLVTPMESLVKKPKDKDIVKYIIGRGLDGKTNSKLISLRRYEGYLNEFDVLETPPIGTDWLYYYRVGAVRNISTINDENGNIRCEVTELENISKGDIISDLYAFGDVIESIEPVGDNGIKIVYWTDVHLKATVNKKTEDDDGNYKVYYTKFEPDYPPIDDFFDENGNPTEKKIASFIWNDEKEQEECQNMTEIKFCDQNDTNNLHGIRYEEIYYFSPNEDEDNISSLIKNGEFEKYVNGDYDDKQANADDASKIKKYEKYEFSTNNNTLSYTQRVNNTDLELSCVISDYETICIREEVNDKRDNEDNGVINGVTISRLPFYESISYTPVEKIDVFIDRGSTSVFDRHIRLSEVKTLNDMLEYSNGSYFTMQN